MVHLFQTYKLGDPTLPGTNLGPVVSLASAARIRKQVEDAGKPVSLPAGKETSTNVTIIVKAGARSLISESHFESAKV